MFQHHSFVFMPNLFLSKLLSVLMLSIIFLPVLAAEKQEEQEKPVQAEETEKAEVSEEEEEEKSKEESEEEKEDESENEENNDEEESADNTPPKLIETSASIDLSYGVFRDDEETTKEVDISGSLNVTINPHDALSIHTTIGKRRETALEIDEAYIDWAVRDDKNVSLKIGKKFAPFGQFSSAMVSSSLPTQLGETDPEAIIEGSVTLPDDSTTLHAYVFKGRSPHIDGIGKHELAYGAALNYETENASIGVGYLSNLAESDAFEAGFNAVAQKIPAAVFHAEIEFGRFTVIGEHLAATKNFAPDDLDEEITVEAKPSATQLEINVALENKGTLAMAWNNTQQAAEIDLAKESVSLAYSHPIQENVSGTIEASRSKDYDQNKSTELIFELSLEHL